MSAIKIRDNIYAVGARDPEVRIFHGYAHHLVQPITHIWF